MPRQARLAAPGTLHPVILRGIERRSIVTDEEDRRQFVERFGWLARELKTAIYAWAVLPTHAHLLRRSGPHGVPTFMRRFLTGQCARATGRESAGAAVAGPRHARTPTGGRLGASAG